MLVCTVSGERDCWICGYDCDAGLPDGDLEAMAIAVSSMEKESDTTADGTSMLRCCKEASLSGDDKMSICGVMKGSTWGKDTGMEDRSHGMGCKLEGWMSIVGATLSEFTNSEGSEASQIGRSATDIATLVETHWSSSMSPAPVWS